MDEKRSFHSEATIICKRICKFLKHFFLLSSDDRAAFNFSELCVHSRTCTDEELCALCWMNKKVLEHKIAENQREIKGRILLASCV